MHATRLSRTDLGALATRVIRGEVYLALNKDMIEHSFGHLFALMSEPLSDSEVESIGGLWEEIGKCSPTGVNGYPFFFSCHLLHRDDVKPLTKMLRKKERKLSGESLLGRLLAHVRRKE